MGVFVLCNLRPVLLLLLPLLAVLLTAYGAYTDSRFGILRVRLSKWALCLAPLFRGGVELLHSGTWAAAQQGAMDSVAGALLCAVTPVLLYRLKSLGRGDVWLLPAVGALLGLRMGVEAQMLTYAFALVLAPAKLVYDGTLFRTLGQALVALGNVFRKPEARKPVPASVLSSLALGPYIFLGTFFEAAYRHIGWFLR